MTISAAQIRQARELLGWSRADLARKAFLSLSIVEVVEEHGSTSMLLAEQMAAVRSVPEDAGVKFDAVEPRLQKGQP